MPLKDTHVYVCDGQIRTFAGMVGFGDVCIEIPQLILEGEDYELLITAEDDRLVIEKERPN